LSTHIRLQNRSVSGHTFCSIIDFFNKESYYRELVSEFCLSLYICVYIHGYTVQFCALW
jgi:hypothetical protein